VRGWIGFEIVKRCDRLRTGPECRMDGDVVDPLCADIDGAAIPHPFELLATRREHECPVSRCDVPDEFRNCKSSALGRVLYKSGSVTRPG
jgi:hypothetical protein